jgi:hypothetical protein
MGRYSITRQYVELTSYKGNPKSVARRWISSLACVNVHLNLLFWQLVGLWVVRLRPTHDEAHEGDS